MRQLAHRLWHSPTFTTWGSLAVRLSGVVLILPLVLTRFAPAEVAVWQLFATLFTLTLLLDFGLSPTFSRLLAYARGGAPLASMGDMRKYTHQADPTQAQGTSARVFATLMWMYPRLAGAALLLLGLGGTWALQHPIAQTTHSTAAWGAWALVLAGSMLGFVGNAYSAALQGMDTIAPLRRWETATGLAQMVTTTVTLLFGGGLFALVLAYQSWVLISCYRNYRLLRALHPHLTTTPANRDAEVLTVLWPATWRSGVGVLMSQGLIQLSGVVYSQLAPAADVASYLLALRVITTVSQFAQAPFYSKLPKLALQHAAQQRNELLNGAQRGMRLAHWIFVAGALLVAAIANPLLTLIGSHTPFVSPQVWALMAAAFFVERFGAMHLQLYSLTNHIVWHIANGITGTLMVAATWLLFGAFGIAAFPLAMLMAYGCFYAAYSAYKSVKAFNISFISFETGASLLPACALSIGLGTALFLQATHPTP